MLGLGKVVGIKTCHSPTIFAGYGTTFTIFYDTSIEIINDYASVITWWGQAKRCTTHLENCCRHIPQNSNDPILDYSQRTTFGVLQGRCGCSVAGVTSGGSIFMLNDVAFRLPPPPLKYLVGFLFFVCVCVEYVRILIDLLALALLPMRHLVGYTNLCFCLLLHNPYHCLFRSVRLAHFIVVNK